MPLQRVVRKMPLHPSGSKEPDDLQYWLTQTVQARIAAVEILRRQSPGYDAQPRLQRVCRITQLKRG
ncbi:MAG: hypothetical protein ABIN37_03060 [Burkholderiaceae bacterium]